MVVFVAPGKGRLLYWEMLPNCRVIPLRLREVEDYIHTYILRIAQSLGKIQGCP